MVDVKQRALTLVAAIAVLAVTGTYVAAGWTRIPPPPAPLVAYAYPAAGGALSPGEVQAIGAQMCEVALSVGSCEDFTVSVEDLGGHDGRTEITWTVSFPAGTETLDVEGIKLSTSLAHADSRYVAYVAAHEFNHVELTNRVVTTAGRDALLADALALFRDRVSPPLTDPVLAGEVLVDCMTVLQDGVDPGTGALPYYLREVMRTQDANVVCAEWWTLVN